MRTSVGPPGSVRRLLLGVWCRVLAGWEPSFIARCMHRAVPWISRRTFIVVLTGERLAEDARMSYNRDDVLSALQAEEIILKKLQQQIESALSTLKAEEHALVETARRLEQEAAFEKSRKRARSRGQTSGL